jgi:hypothetical protein
MSAIRIRRTLESETLNLPELRPLLGKEVEITVEETAVPAAGHGDWDLVQRLVNEISDYDFDALKDQEEYELRHAQDHLL